MKRLAVVGALSAALIVAACGGGEKPTSDPGAKYADGATFSMALSVDPGQLDPATGVQGSTNLLNSFAYDRLVYVDADGELVSGLATEWEVEPKEVTFTLHPDATCSDGSPVTPEVVARSISRYVDPETKSPLLGVLIPADLTAKADDAAGTVTLRTKEPNQFLAYTASVIFIICGKGLDDPSILATETSGSGPYELTESVANDHYTFTVRDGYSWGPGGTGTDEPGIPETVNLRVINNESTATNLLLSGDLNSIQLSGPDRARVEGTDGVTTTLSPAGVGEFFYNQQDGRPTADPAVREALTTGLNLTELASVATEGTGVEITGLATLAPRPCRVDSVSGHLPEYDPEAAKTILDQAGWVEGADGIRAKDGTRLAVRIVYNTEYGAGIQAGAEYQAKAWSELGADATVQALPSAAWTEAIFSTGDWDVSTVPIGVSLPTQLLGFLSGPAAPDGSNFAHLDNADYVRLTKEAAAVPIADGGCEVWAEAESALIENFDVVPYAELTELIASKGAEVTIIGGLAQPTLFRMLAG